MGGGYYLQKVVLTVAEGSEWTCLGWSCPNKVVRLITLFPETDIYYPGSCGKAEGLFGDKSERPNHFPIEDSFSESSVSKYGWEGRETGPNWRSRDGERPQPWLPVRGVQQLFQHECRFKLLNLKLLQILCCHTMPSDDAFLFLQVELKTLQRSLNQHFLCFQCFFSSWSS